MKKKIFILAFFVCFILGVSRTAVMAASTTSDITVNNVQSDSSSYGDEKLYYFSLSSAGKVNITFTHANLSTTSTQWRLAIYNLNNENLMQMDSAGTETNKTSTDVGLPVGEYYVKLNAWHGETQDYTLKVNYSASNNWESENNDGYGKANSIVLNTQYSGANQFDSDDDYYEFSLASAGKVSINFQHPVLNNNNGYWYAEIYNEQTEKLLQLSIYGTETNVTSAELGLEAGKYYLKIDTGLSRGGFYSNATYAVKLNYAVSGTWESENNDGYGAADAISLNTQYSGANQFDSDDDYYKIHLPSAGKISINFQHPILMDNNMYWQLYVYNEKTEILLKTNIHGTEYNITTGELGLPAGNYYLMVDANFNYFASSTYNFTVNYAAADNWETEVNDGYAEADEIIIGTTYYGANQIYNDHDYYRFSLSSPNTVKINFSHKNLNDNASYWRVYLYNATNDELGKFDVGGTEVSSSGDILSLAAGTYYIRVIPYNHSTSTYGLNVSYSAPIATPKLKASASYNKINLSWNAVNDVDGYYIYRSTSISGSYNEIERIQSRAISSYTDTSVTTGFTYYYKICTYRDVSGKRKYGEYSNTVKAKTALGKVNLISVKAGKRKATLKWKEVSGASGYEVYMSTKETKGYKKVKTLTKVSKVKYIKKGLKTKKTYYFKVRAYKIVSGKKVYGSYSTPNKVTVK